MDPADNWFQQTPEIKKLLHKYLQISLKLLKTYNLIIHDIFWPVHAFAPWSDHHASTMCPHHHGFALQASSRRPGHVSYEHIDHQTIFLALHPSGEKVILQVKEVKQMFEYKGTNYEYV